VELPTASTRGWLDDPLDPRLTGQHRFPASGLGQKWIGGRLPREDVELVQGLAATSLRRCDEASRSLVHGDVSPYNFVFRGRSLAGVLDAAPVVGGPLFDLVTAFRPGQWMSASRR
jgi:Ser/Thr protein kinase RdoA (MazF antagonist)